MHGHAVHARYEFLRAAAPGGPHDCYEGSLVQRLNALGLAVRAYDQQSFGASEGARQGTRGFVERFDDLVDDFLALAEPLKRWCAERRLPLFVLATSMGGCVVTRALQRRPKACDGAVFVAPMLSLEAAKKQPANRVLLPVVGATPQPVPVYSGALLLFQAQAPGGKVVSGVSRLSQRSWSRAPQWWPWYRVCTTVLQFGAHRLWSWLT